MRFVRAMQETQGVVRHHPKFLVNTSASHAKAELRIQQGTEE